MPRGSASVFSAPQYIGDVKYPGLLVYGTLKPLSTLSPFYGGDDAVRATTYPNVDLKKDARIVR